MPHVVIEEALDLPVASHSIKLTAVRNGSEILKVVDVYLDRSGHTELVDCVVVEEGRSQPFFVQLSQKNRQITVRLLPATDPGDCSRRRTPATDPEKTVGVMRIMGLIAKQLHESIGGSRFGKTNLQEFLHESRSAG